MIFDLLDKNFPMKTDSERKVCQAEKRACSKLQIVEITWDVERIKKTLVSPGERCGL